MQEFKAEPHLLSPEKTPGNVCKFCSALKQRHFNVPCWRHCRRRLPLIDIKRVKRKQTPAQMRCYCKQLKTKIREVGQSLAQLTLLYFRKES